MLPQGTGQFIAGVGYAEGSRRFEANGSLVATPSSHKLFAGGYLEYGLTDRLTVIVAPSFSDGWGQTTDQGTGSDESAVGARVGIFQTPDTSLALQALIQPPIGNESQVQALDDGGARLFAADLRLAYGHSFWLLGAPAFIDIEPGYKVRGPPFPNEGRLDVTFGVRPTSRLMLLLQNYDEIAGPSGPSLPSTAYSKIEASFVYDFSAAWSVQGGFFSTVLGRNVLRDGGPIVAAWYRF